MRRHGSHALWRNAAVKGADTVSALAKKLRRIPVGASVEPALFPEDEYPVRCLTCGYSLRGLPDGRCPECGASFERGRLLVDIYARSRRPAGDRWRRVTMWLINLSLIGLALVWVVMLGVWLAVRRDAGGFMDFLLAHDPRPWFAAGFGVALTATLGPFVAAGIELATGPSGRKRRAVRAAARRV